MYVLFRLPLNLQPPSFLGKFFRDEAGDAPRPPQGGGGRRRSQDVPPTSTQDDVEDVDDGDFDDYDPQNIFPDDIPSADDTSSIHLNLSDTFGDTSRDTSQGDPMDVDDDPQDQQQQQQDDTNDIHRRSSDPGPHLRCPRFCNPGMTKCWYVEC